MREILISSAVIAAVIASFSNLIISIINSNKIKKQEIIKRNHAIETYRYTKLYEVLEKWVELNDDFQTKGKTLAQIAADRIINGFLNDHRKHEMIKPLISDKYKKQLDDQYNNTNNYLMELLDLESSIKQNESKELKDKHQTVFSDFSRSAVQYEELIIKVINIQMSELMK